MSLEMTQEAFQAEIQRRREEDDLSFLLALYAALDAYVEQCITSSGIQIVCRKGCSFCCFLLVTCTELEFDEIERYIRSLQGPARKAIIKGAKKVCWAWQKYERQHPRLGLSNPAQVHDDWLYKKPCPFLASGSGACRIYPVRPIDCRAYLSTEQCTKGHVRAERFRFDPEMWANNLIMEEDQRRRRGGMKQTTPLHAWLLHRGLVPPKSIGDPRGPARPGMRPRRI